MKLVHKNIKKVFKLRDKQSQQYYSSDEKPDGVFISHDEYKTVMSKYPDAKYIVEEYDLHLIGDDIPAILMCIQNMITQLNTIFDSDIMGWHSINFQPHSAWHLYDHSEVGYTDLKEDEDDMPVAEFLSLWKDDEKDLQYSFEVYGSSIWYADEFTAFVGDDGSGNRDIYIFCKELQLKLDD